MGRDGEEREEVDFAPAFQEFPRVPMISSSNSGNLKDDTFAKPSSVLSNKVTSYQFYTPLPTVTEAHTVALRWN